MKTHMKTRKTTQRRTILSGALTAGAIIFTLNAGLYVAILFADAVRWLQAGGGAGGSQPLAALHLPMVLLTAVIVTALPVGLWAAVLRRRAVASRLSATSTAHGKYLPWGRSLRRHASVPARYGGRRPRKPLRPMRRRAD